MRKRNRPARAPKHAIRRKRRTRRVGRDRIAETFGVHPATVRGWIKAGCPHARRGRNVLFDLREVETWIEATGRTCQPGRPIEKVLTEMDSVLLRKERAIAERREMDLAVQREEYISRAEVEQGRVQRVLTVKDGLYSMIEPAGEEMENKSAAEIRELLRLRIETLLRAFSGGEEIGSGSLTS